MEAESLLALRIFFCLFFLAAGVIHWDIESFIEWKYQLVISGASAMVVTMVTMVAEVAYIDSEDSVDSNVNSEGSVL